MAQKMKKKIYYIAKEELEVSNNLDNSIERVDNITDLRNRFLKSENDEFESVLFNKKNDFEDGFTI